MSPRKLQNLCAGKWVTSATTEYSNVYNPATGEVIAEHPLSTQSEIDQIIAGAVKAFEYSVVALVTHLPAQRFWSFLGDI